MNNINEKGVKEYQLDIPKSDFMVEKFFKTSNFPNVNRHV
jgi:hypothetical protein